MKRKILCILCAMLMLVSVFSMSVSAEPAMSPIYGSGPMTAGVSWTSPIKNINGSKTTYYGRDAGVYFYQTSVDMPEQFVRNNTRIGYYTLMESDATFLDADETVCTYTGFFSVDYRGIYQMTHFSPPNNVLNGVIETNNQLELYFTLRIDVLTGDTITSIPAGLVEYRYWAN